MVDHELSDEAVSAAIAALPPVPAPA
jgi:hypothetical protein